MCSKNVPTQSSADNIETSNQLGTDNLAVTPHIDPNPLHKFREQNYTAAAKLHQRRVKEDGIVVPRRGGCCWSGTATAGRSSRFLPPARRGRASSPERTPSLASPVPLAFSQQQELSAYLDSSPVRRRFRGERPRKETSWPPPPIARNLRWPRRKSIRYLISFSSDRFRI
jgi:hypothetical protein